MKFPFPIFLFLLALSSFAQQEIKIEDAKDYVGDSVKICARIYGGKYLPNVKGMPTLLNMGGNYPDAPMTLMIWSELRAQFENPPEEFYKDTQVCVVGRIRLYKGKPEIVLRSRNQILSAVKDDEVIDGR